ncbi:MAG TPA: flagellar hook-length control protein FliK [Pseudorhizobium sp.]|nr:flagellar hook-length control protein FliK [Pseudorhizobium sp.]
MRNVSDPLEPAARQQEEAQPSGLPSIVKKRPERTANADEQVDQAEKPADPERRSETGDAAAPESRGAQSAADVLDILGPSLSATAVHVTGRQAHGAGENRKGTAGNGTDVFKVASDRADQGKSSNEASSAVLAMPTEGDVGAATDRSYRFVNARNGSTNIELTSAAAQRSDTASDEVKTGKQQTEQVMVIDSRRFIGVQGGSNSTSLMAAMVGDQSWSSAMRPDASLSNIASQSSSGSVVHMLKLQMTPHDLGTVTATLKMSGDQLHVHLTVETRAAHRQLSEDSSGMLDALRSQGFSVDQVTVSVAPNGESDPQRGQQGSQAGQQQAPANGERQGNANRNSSGERFSTMADGRSGDDEASLDITAASSTPGSGSARAGQLYL